MINFKNKKDVEMFPLLHPVLIMIFSDLNWYAQWKHFTDLTVTATVSTKLEDKILNRVSDSHRTHRAIDIRTKDLDPFIVSDLINYINNKKEYDNYKYVSNGGIKRLAYFHIGSAEHIHLAIHSRFSLKGLSKSY